MKFHYHPANSRGHASHGWLDSYHSFSFSSYFNPDRMHFGLLRVLNDDTVAPGKGFDAHPHNDMEIISIPLYGDLEHRDSMGNVTVIKEGDIQVMSAGTGVVHSEYNRNQDKQVRFLQIWIYPDKKGHQPRYDQMDISEINTKNKFGQILSPNPEDDGVWIHQNAWFHLAELDPGTSLGYKLKDQLNGVYVFVLEGKIKIGHQELNRRDGLGIEETDSLELTAESPARILLMEVPMN